MSQFEKWIRTKLINRKLINQDIRFNNEFSSEMSDDGKDGRYGSESDIWVYRKSGLQPDSRCGPEPDI